MNREIAIAVRCQLLTGSYDGASRSCDCIAPGACVLNEEQRLRLIGNPKVVRANRRNLKEFQSLIGADDENPSS